MADYQDISRLDKVKNQLGQAWEMATTGKYSTWNNSLPFGQRVSHVGHRLSDAFSALLSGNTRVENMHARMADDLLAMGFDADDADLDIIPDRHEEAQDRAAQANRPPPAAPPPGRDGM